MSLIRLSDHMPAVGEKSVKAFKDAAEYYRKRGDAEQAEACLRRAELTRQVFGLPRDAELPFVPANPQEVEA